MNFKTLLPIYLVVLTAECAAILTENQTLQMFTKPLLMPVLIFYFALNSKKLPSAKFSIIAALLFSWIGDVILLLDKIYGNLFVFGLLGFLVAHLFYIFYFLQIRKREKKPSKLKAFSVIGVLIYSTAVYLTLFQYLGAMKIPVLIYSLIISLMLLASFHAFRSFDKNFAKLCVAGTIIFALSDTILAINRFAFPFSFAPIFVMLTYGIAQLLITEGSRKQLSVNSEQLSIIS